MGPSRACLHATVQGRSAPARARRRWAQSEEIGWVHSQEIRWVQSQEIGWAQSEEILQPITASDDAIMQWARARDAVVLTHDLDFAAILAASGGQKPSVIQIRADRLTPEAIGAHVLALLRQFAPELAQGALLTIEPGRARALLLPLPPKT